MRYPVERHCRACQPIYNLNVKKNTGSFRYRPTVSLACIRQPKRVPAHLDTHRLIFCWKTKPALPQSAQLCRMFNEHAKWRHGGVAYETSRRRPSPVDRNVSRAKVQQRSALTESIERPTVSESLNCLDGSMSRSCSSSPLLAAVLKPAVSPVVSPLVGPCIGGCT